MHPLRTETVITHVTDGRTDIRFDDGPRRPSRRRSLWVPVILSHGLICGFASTGG
jgi:hypothetical protein